MNSPVNRRRFVQASGLFLAGTAASSLLGRTSPAEANQAGDRLRKAVGWEMIQEKKLSVEDKLRLLKDVGFEGVEMSAKMLKESDPKVLTRACEKAGVVIHGVVGAHPDLPGAIEQAALYGATSVLYVVRADPTGSYMENYRRSQETIRAAIPTAEKKRVPILIENVWATFLIEPLTMARYIDELNSPYVKSYFDVGNVMRWGVPQQWIEVLGKRIGKIHIKEYNLKVAMREGMIKGFDFPLGQGDIDWKRVREALKAVGYQGWATAEVRGGDRQRLADISAQMDRVLNP